MPATAPEPLWTDAEVAAYLACSPRVVLRLVRAEGLPLVDAGSRRRRYRPESVLAWVKARESVRRAAPAVPPTSRPASPPRGGQAALRGIEEIAAIFAAAHAAGR